jgi:hypothetical protein
MNKTKEVERKLIMLDKQPVISLPREWVKYWELDKNKPLHIFYNSVLVVIPYRYPDLKILESQIRTFLMKNGKEI